MDAQDECIVIAEDTAAPPMPDLTIRGARIAGGYWGAGEDTPHDIEITNGRIESIAPSEGREARGPVIEASGRIATPGFVNGHQHSHELFFRGRSERVPLEEWMCSVRPVAPLPLTDEDAELRTRAVAAEALLSGTTTICDDVGIDPASARGQLDAVVRGYASAGIRAHVGPSLFDVPFARAVPFAEEHLPADALAEMDAAAAEGPSPEARLAAFEDFARGLARAGGLVRAIAAPSAPQRCTVPFLAAVRALADRVGLPVMTHVLETRVQAVGAAVAHGRSLVAELAALGFLKPRTSLIHGVWLTPRDMEILAEAGATVQLNPWSNLKLGSGAPDMRGLLDAGVNVSIGSDGCGSVETVRMGPAMAAAAMLSTLRGEPERWVSAAEVFTAATLGGARALGREAEIGRLAPGHAADIVLWRTDRAPLMPLNDAMRQIVYADAGAAVNTVLVAGRVAVWEGRLTQVDEAALAEELAAANARLAPHLAEADAAAARLAPGMRAIRERCAHHPLPGVRPAVLE